MGLFDSIAGSLAGGIPSLIGTGVNAIMQGQNNITQQQAVGQQEAYQTQMSDTAYQRQVADMKAAGINPILSAQTGGGASTPTGSMPTTAAPQIQMPDFMSYGVSLRQLDQADQKIAIDKANSAANIAKTLSDTQVNKLQQTLMKTGLAGRELGTDSVTKFQNVIQSLKNSVLSPKQPTRMGQPESSGGTLYPSSTGMGSIQTPSIQMQGMPIGNPTIQ